MLNPFITQSVENIHGFARPRETWRLKSASRRSRSSSDTVNEVGNSAVKELRGWPLAALAIDESDDARDSSGGQQVSDKYIEAIQEARNHNVRAAKCFDISDVRGIFGGHTGVFALLANGGAGAEFSLSDAGAE